MVTAPLFVLLLLAAVVGLKTHAAKGGSLALGVALGLTLAATVVGPPILHGFEAVTEGVVSALGSLAVKR